MTRFLLVPSPLLGPSTWRPTAEWLQEAGLDTTVLDTRGVESADELVDRAADAAEAAAAAEPVVLVPHSNAGLSAPLARCAGQPASDGVRRRRAAARVG